MTEEKFKIMLIELVNDSSDVLIQDKCKLIKGMNLMQVKYYKTRYKFEYLKEFKAYIHLNVPCEYFAIVKKYEELLLSLSEDIFREDGYLLDNIHINPVECTIDENNAEEDVVRTEVFFENIEYEILKRIYGTETKIYIVMYRFTNSKIYEALMRKKDEGIRVEIILDDNEYNRKEARKWSELNIRYVKLNNYIMHNKFCIIDMKTVLEGSYNWTTAANHNEESMTVCTGSSIANVYAAKFDDIKDKAV